jgi:hypothetical protein
LAVTFGARSLTHDGGVYLLHRFFGQLHLRKAVHFLANERYFHPLLLADNLVTWCKRLCLPAEYQTATLQTLRHTILLMPAQLQRVGTRARLSLPASGPQDAAWAYALHQIKRLSW